KTVSLAFPVVDAWLRRSGSLALTVASDGLLVDGQRAPAGDAAAAAVEQFTIAALRESRISGVRFSSGLASTELVAFLHAWAHRFWDLPDPAAINARLREASVEHAAIEEVAYVAVGKDGLEALETAGIDMSEVLESLQARIERAVQSGEGAELRMHVLRTLVEQDPSIVARLNEETPPPVLLQDATGTLTIDRLKAVLQPLSAAYTRSSTVGRDAVRAAAHAALEAFRPHTGLRASLRRLVWDLGPDLVPDWLAAEADEEEPAVVNRTWTVLGLTPSLRAEALAREGAGLVRELMLVDRADLAEKIFDLLLADMAESSVRRRRWALDCLVKLKEDLEQASMERLRAGLEQRVHERLDRESDVDAYSRLADLAVFLADSRLRRGEVNEALRIIDVLKRHSMIKDAAFPERQRLVLPRLDRVTSGEGYKAVAGALKGSQSAADGLQRAMDEAAVRFLVSQMKDIESTAERLRVGESVFKTAPDAPAVLCAEVRATTVPSQALRLLEVLPTLCPQGIAEETMGELVRSHPVQSVRRRASILLVERNYPKAPTLLVAAFREERDAAMRGALAEAIGKLPGATGFALLHDAAASRETPDELRIACCLALGRKGDVEALPLLTELAERSAKGLTGLFRSVSPAVRAAAARALGGFKGRREATDLLARLQEDPEPGVREAVQQALNPSSRPTLRKPAETGPDRGSLAGSLASIPLDQVLQMLGGSGKTGVLQIRGEGVDGNLYLVDGRIVHVEASGRRGQEAFNHLFGSVGAFFFKADVRCPAPGEPVDVARYLLEASRVKDEARKF
ncbi:MAG TPA: DUF4388 domain-containing protein, partial [Planctomycetota bacterium]|nr:DUF4388 domain-containing protein [Planctomycetota bacterium]